MTEKREIGLIPQEKGPWTIYTYASAFLLLIMVVMTFFLVKDMTATINEKALVVISHTGGLCSDGNVCSHTNTIYANGLSTDGSITLTEKEISTIESLLVSSDLSTLTTAETPDCPSFYDGQDVSYVFPDYYDDNVFTPCLINDKDADELFSYLGSIQE
jgi:hypothetical protein